LPTESLAAFLARGEPDDMRAALDVLEDALVVVDLDLRVLFGNATLARDLGGLPGTFADDVVEQAGGAVLREDGSLWPAPDRPLMRAARDGVATREAMMGVRLGEQTRWVQVCAQPLVRPGESRAYAAVATYHDVTGKVLAENALADTEAAFRALAENSTDAVQRHAMDGMCLYSSPAIGDVLGWSPQEIQGTYGTSRVHPDDLAAFARDQRTLVHTREPQLTRYRALHADGSWVWVETLSRAVAGLDGRVHEVQTSTRDVTARVDAERRLARLSLTDALTGLANRAALVQHLEDRLSSGGEVALLFLDLDRFKVVNDSLGHSAGDELLRVVAGRLAGTCRDDDLVARLGGDEFVVVAAGLNEAAAVHLADRVQQVLAAPVSVGGHELVVSASVGIVVGDPARVLAEELLRDADVSMYRAKARGRGQAVVWTEEISDAAVARLAVERDLRAALASGGLEVYFQPQVHLATGRVVGVEALVRWQHPVRGLLLPGAFLDVADDSGLVVDLGRQVLTVAARQVAAWRALPGYGALELSVNVSAQELRRPGSSAGTLEVLQRAGLPLDALTVEVLESVLLDAEGAVAAALAEHAEAGIRLALDDFGTGSSSLLHLRHVPVGVGVVKVDRVFVAGLGSSRRDEAIVRALRSLTADLGLACVAEGVETQDQREWLTAEGVALAQGFLLHRPLDAASLTVLLRSSG